MVFSQFNSINGRDRHFIKQDFELFVNRLIMELYNPGGLGRLDTYCNL